MFGFFVVVPSRPTRLSGLSASSLRSRSRTGPFLSGSEWRLATRSGESGTLMRRGCCALNTCFLPFWKHQMKLIRTPIWFLTCSCLHVFPTNVGLDLMPTNIRLPSPIFISIPFCYWKQFLLCNVGKNSVMIWGELNIFWPLDNIKV